MKIVMGIINIFIGVIVIFVTLLNTTGIIYPTDLTQIYKLAGYCFGILFFVIGVHGISDYVSDRNVLERLDELEKKEDTEVSPEN